MVNTFEVVWEFRAALHNVSSNRNSREYRLQQCEDLSIHLTWEKKKQEVRRFWTPVAPHNALKWTCSKTYSIEHIKKKPEMYLEKSNICNADVCNTYPYTYHSD